MGSRSAERARAQANVVSESEHYRRPPTLIGASLVQGVQALAILLAAVLAGVAAIQGKSYQSSSGIAITAIGIGTAVALGLVALGVARAGRWSRTPALLTQLFTGIIGIYLIHDHRYSWGVPGVLLSAAGFVLLLVPPSLRALHSESAEPPAPAK
ncbi:MAG TPA: hypothetical protein VNF47_07010 [Streptosporangiaceae bacterium]|nr:hypothetical protein [Streptosporangiaceae bacterium]